MIPSPCWLVEDKQHKGVGAPGGGRGWSVSDTLSLEPVRGDKMGGRDVKTPEEIKKGLECCTATGYNCDDCPYVDVQACTYCKLEKSKDAIALIQQLEAELRDAKENHQHTINIAERQKEQIGKLKDVIVKKIPRWISVKERLPEGEPTYCLTVNVLTIDGKVLPGFCNHGKWYVMREEDDYCKDADEGEVTHWMPMPLPPSSPDGESTSLGDGGSGTT